MRVISVAELNRYIKDKLENDLLLNRLWLKGEISNFKNHSSGHLYFTLKDRQAAVKCVMFRSRAAGVEFVPKDGMSVIARGYVSVFERDGQYQLYVEELQPDGIGALYIAFQQLKEKLEREGLFADEIKKPIPKVPKRIAVVTSPTGAAVRDIINVLHRRCPSVEIILVPVAVQGDNAPPEIAEAINNVNLITDIDVIIVGRGGGSLEELWAFNTEIVARSIFASRIPIISAVGHETDYTIADFVSDLRAPTPSAAAELATPDLRDMALRLKNMSDRLSTAVYDQIEKNRTKVQLYSRSTVLSRPFDRINMLSQKVDFLTSRLEQSTKTIFQNRSNRFGVAVEGLSKLSPLATLERGYAFCQADKTGQVVTKTAQVQVGQRLSVRLSDGILGCTVDNVEEG